MEASNISLVFEQLENQFIDSLFQLDLTVSETVSLYLIAGLKKPNISEYAKKMGISQSNATYTIQKLISKGYLGKLQSDQDRRQFFLEVTDKFYTEIAEPKRTLERKIEQSVGQLDPQKREVIEEFFQNFTEDSQ
jgi:DNA-binding MarR family transcriptional regulator